MSLSRLVARFEAWSLLVLGLLAGLVLPHLVTTAAWTAAARAFVRAGDLGMVDRLTSATRFGVPIARRLGVREGLAGAPPDHPREGGGPSGVGRFRFGVKSWTQLGSPHARG
jgi:hypothetical protein